MAAMRMRMSCALILVMVLVALWSPEAEAVTCGEVVSAVAPCLGYLRNGGSQVCCNGVRGLRNKARTTGDRKAICNCLKSASSSYRGVSGNYAASLPRKCGINIPYKISPSIDCNRYNKSPTQCNSSRIKICCSKINCLHLLY